MWSSRAGGPLFSVCSFVGGWRTDSKDSFEFSIENHSFNNFAEPVLDQSGSLKELAEATKVL